MNIFFCDGCGVRVTDADLRGGHGVRRRNEVFCAACVDRGRASSSAKLGVAAAPVAALPTASAGEPPHDPTARVPVVQPDLAAAASNFSALAAAAVDAERKATDEDDLDESSEHDAPSRTDLPSPPERPLPAATATKAPDPAADAQRRQTDGAAAPPQAAAAETDDPSSAPNARERAEKDKPPTRATVRADRTATRTPSPSAASNRARSSTVSPRAATGGANGSRPTTQRSARPGQKSGRKLSRKDQKLLAFSLIGVAVLLGIIVTVLLINQNSAKPKPEPEIQVDYLKDLRVKADAARSAAQSALQREPPTLAEIDAARRKISELQSEMGSFERNVKERFKWTQEQVDTQMQQLGTSDINSLMINLGQARAKILTSGGR
jgi:hypothetical protein